MKILFLSLEFPPMVGGIASATHSQDTALRALGHDVHLLVPSQREGAHPEARCWLRRPAGTLDHRRATCENAAALRKALDEVRPDLVWFGDACARIASRFAPGELPPYVVYVYGTELITPRPLATWLSGRHTALRKALAGASQVLAVSRYTQSLLESFRPGTPSTVIYAPYDADKIGTRPALLPSPFEGPGPHVLSVCRLAPRKNVSGSMRIMARLREHLPGLQFHVVGGGPQAPALQELARSEGWDWVRFHGRLPEDELRNVYSHGDAYIMCSRPDKDGVEGQGLTYIEATLSGCLAIGTAHGGAAEVIQDGVTGLAIDPDDIEEAVRHILPWLEDPARRAALQEQAAASHRKRFGMESFCNAVSKALKQLPKREY